MNSHEMDQILSRHEEEKLYEMVAEELANNEIRAGLMAKALAESNGDINFSRSLYIKLRIQSILDEIKFQIHQEKENEIREKEKQKQYATDRQNKVGLLLKRASQAKILNNHEEELLCYDEILKLNNISNVYMDRGQLLWDMCRYEGAIESFKKAVEYGALREECYCKIAIIYGTFLDNRQEAIKWNEEALKVNSTSETALHNIGINLYHMGNYQRAIVYFDKLLKLIPNREGTIEFRNKAMSKLNTQCQ